MFPLNIKFFFTGRIYFTGIITNVSVFIKFVLCLNITIGSRLVRIVVR
jgi:hypothetical protein